MRAGWLLLSLLVTVGCVGCKSTGAPEPAAINPAKVCAAKGFPYGTLSMAQCIQRESALLRAPLTP